MRVVFELKVMVTGSVALKYDHPMADVVRIELGSSILEGERIVQEATAAGLYVQLLRNGDPHMGGTFALGSCSLLVTVADEADLRDLLADFNY